MEAETEDCEIALKTLLQSKLDTVGSITDFTFKYVNTKALVPNTSSLLLKSAINIHTFARRHIYTYMQNNREKFKQHD